MYKNTVLIATTVMGMAEIGAVKIYGKAPGSENEDPGVLNQDPGPILGPNREQKFVSRAPIFISFTVTGDNGDRGQRNVSLPRNYETKNMFRGMK